MATTERIVKPDHASAIAELTQPGTKKFAVAKRLVQISEDQPKLLVAHFADFCRLLRTPNNIIRWSVIRIVANLAAADCRLRLDRILDHYLSPIAGPARRGHDPNRRDSGSCPRTGNMITAVNTIQGAARIAQSRKRLAPRLIQAILQVERAHYETAECRNVAIGQAIKALNTLGPSLRRKPEILAFVQRQRKNPRLSTAKLAESFLRRAASTNDD